MVNEITPAKILRERDVLDTLWRFFSSTELMAVVLFVVALASAFGALFPQAPSQAIKDPAVYAQWLEGAQARYGRWFGFLDTMDLFNVYSSWWFRSLLALLAFSLIISTAEMIHLYADRFWVEALALLRYVGLIVILAGAVITSRLGWREDAVTLSPGQSYEIGHGLDAILRFDELELDTYPDGSPRYRTHLRIIEDGAEVERVIEVNRPFTYRGVGFYQISHGMAVAVKASDRGGHPLTLQSFADGARMAAVVSLPFWGHQSERHFAVPDRGTVFQLVFYQSLPDRGYDGPVFLVEAYQDGRAEPIYSRFVEKSGSLEVGDVTYDLALGPYSALRIVRDPAITVVVLGLLLTIVGNFLWLYRSPIRFWAVVSEKDGRATVQLTGAVERGKAGSASWFEGLDREIEGEGKDG